MQAAIYEAVDENDGEPTRLTVSGDRTCQKRDLKSIHGVTTVLSCTAASKILNAG
ncbi:unnamed protein product, partial [Rotaria sp. Silwood2]